MAKIDLSVLINQIKVKNYRALARAISIVENEASGWEYLLQHVPSNSTPIIGITGPPGAGKSSLLNKIVEHLTSKNKTIAVIAVDPTSPFNYGALLGDRVRLNTHYNNPNVYIRSVASRKSLGGLSDKIIEICEVVKAADFDYVFLETVGVGQSEVEIAGVADTSVVVLVPEAGDEIQTMKAGVMEIGDIFVVNKSDRENAATFVKNLRSMVAHKHWESWQPPVLKTVATTGEGIDELITQIHAHAKSQAVNDKQAILLTEKAWKIIQRHKMSKIDRSSLQKLIEDNLQENSFNLFSLLKEAKYI